MSELQTFLEVMMSEILIALMAGVATPMDIEVSPVFYMGLEDPQPKYYGAEAKFLAHLMQDQLYMRMGILYFIRDHSDGFNLIGFGSGVSGFEGASCDALYYFTKQKTGKYKMSPYVLGGLYFISLNGDLNLYGLKAGAGASFPLGKKSPMRFFGEGGALIDGFSISGSDGGSDIYITVFFRGGMRFNIVK